MLICLRLHLLDGNQGCLTRLSVRMRRTNLTEGLVSVILGLYVNLGLVDIVSLHEI